MTHAAIRTLVAQQSLAAPTVVISPHLDDAVFGCGEWLASHMGAVVVTVFAGEPEAAGPLTEWDEKSGFQDTRQAVLGRRREDQLAMAVLKSEPVWLDFPDHQYGQTVDVRHVALELEHVLAAHAPAKVLFPLGLFHSDHLLTFDAVRLALSRFQGIEVLVYEDALYRCMDGLLQQRLTSLAQGGISATPVWCHASLNATAIKQAAVQQYVSQFKAFGPNGVDDLARPERLWRLKEIQA